MIATRPRSPGKTPAAEPAVFREAAAVPAVPAAASARPAGPAGIVYVLGYGRSGSTLLDVLLGSLPDVCGVGELDLLHRDWTAGRCSCGETYDECGFWSAVRAGTDAAAGAARPADRERTLRRVESLSFLPALLLGLLPRRWTRAYRRQVRAEAAALRAVAGTGLVLDSSKSAREAAGRAIALRRLAGLDVRTVHLVRDGRAVIWSVRRGDNVKLGGGAEGAAAGFSWPSVRAVLGWCLANSLALLATALAPRGTALRVRYEDLVADPDRETARIGAFLGLDATDVRRRLREGEPFPVGHSTGGNRMRRSGAVRVRTDREWETRVHRRDRIAFWLVAWPLALALGYRPRPG